jgi:hypothetical protein
LKTDVIRRRREKRRKQREEKHEIGFDGVPDSGGRQPDDSSTLKRVSSA